MLPTQPRICSSTVSSSFCPVVPELRLSRREEKVTRGFLAHQVLLFLFYLPQT